MVAHIYKISFWNHIRMRSLQKSCSSETETNKFTEKKITKVIFNTSSTAQGGGGSCKNKKPIGQVDCCRTMDRKVVGVSGYLSVYLSVFLSVRLSVDLSVLSTYLSVDLYVYLSVYLHIYLSICISISLSICNYLYVSLSVCLYLSACLSFYLAVRLTTYLSVWLSI